MAHCTFRLSITPERAPDVRRVVDFDGRNSLHDVHWMIQETFELDADHLYAFYLSGKYFDTQSEYGEGSSRPADTALLFRLGLRQGQSFAYLFDFGDELRHTVTVLSVTDVQAPLTEPLLVESIGEAPRQYEDDEDDESDEGQESEEDEVVSPKVARLEPQVRRFLELYAVLEPRRGAKADAATLHELAQAALELGQRLEGDIGTFAELDGCFSEDDLALRLLELPERLSLAGDTESALAVARAFTFLAPDQLRGELSVIYARAGRRAEAEAQIAANLASVENASIAEGKAGEAYLALGEPASAEAYYQRALVEAIHPRDRELALARLATFLLESGRESEAQAFLKQLNRPARAPAAVSTARLGVPAVGRNEPCPCGSGKKYKKCHGAPVG